MSLFFIGLFNQFKGWIIAAGAALAFIAGVYLKGVSAGDEKRKAKNAKELLKNVKRKKEIEQDVDSLSNDAVDEQLRNDWKQR